LCVGDTLLTGKKEMQQHGADVGFQKDGRLVEGKGGNGAGGVRSDAG
jgi:hypothetical protein